VAVVATDDPQMAPKPVHAPITDMASPPRKWPTKALAARKRSVARPDLSAKAPIRMNSGITDRV
jgi:hypothetical protein